MIYQSKREKIKELFEKYIIPGINEKDLDYNLVIEEVCKDVSCSREMAEDVLKPFIKAGIIEEIRILTIAKNKIDNWLENQKKKIGEINKEFEDAGLNVKK